MISSRHGGRFLAALFLCACGTDAPEDPRGVDMSPSGADDAGEDDADGDTGHDAALGNGDGAGQPDASVTDFDSGLPTCADVQTTPVRSIPSVMFLIDGSSSMECVYPEDPSCDCESQLLKTCTAAGQTTRWQALSAALFGAGPQPGLVDTLGGAIRFGFWVYNNSPLDGVCPAFPSKIEPDLNQGAALSAAFPAEPPGYNTPTGLALAALAAALPDAAQAGQQGLGPQRIVLATDGQPFQCVDPDTLDKPELDYSSVLSAADDARAKAIDLYVMSLAPAAGEFADHLAEVARRGQTLRAYAPADREQLSTALDEIIGGAISCTVELRGEIERPSECTGSATLGDQTLTCGDRDGYAIVDATHVELRGAACDRFKHEPGVELRMTFPCDAIVLQ